MKLQNTCIKNVRGLVVSEVKVLDCTLRDGGYVVNTIFQDYVIKGIVQKLVNSNIDIIELGYLKDCTRALGSTTCNSLDEMSCFLPSKRNKNTKYAVMVEYNTLDLSKLTQKCNSEIDIIRICFFKKDRFEIFDYVKNIINKGFEVYLQPMDTINYNDSELLELVDITNKLGVSALYIVDSYGSMYEENLEHIYSILNHNLLNNISIGIHSHNNLQMSFMLVQNLIKISKGERNVIVDASCGGIGRGAGNACSELIVDYCNRKLKKDYNIDEILDILDSYISKIQKKHQWGYSTPYFISGKYSVHVNNISYLLSKHNLKAKDIKFVISQIDKDADKRYDYAELENIIVNYNSTKNRIVDNLDDLRNIFADSHILVCAPGKSILKESNKIQNYIVENDPIVVSVNAFIPNLKTDYIFYSNILRYEYSKEKYPEEFSNVQKILSSNIKQNSGQNEYIVDYYSLIKRGWKFFDNSTILCLRLLKNLGVKNISIAGFDGYLLDQNSGNYVDDEILFNLSERDKIQLNKDLSEMLKDFKTKNTDVHIQFITDSLLNIN